MNVYANKIYFAAVYLTLETTLAIGSVFTWRDIYFSNINNLPVIGYGLIAAIISPVAFVYVAVFSYRILILNEPYAIIQDKIVIFKDPFKYNLDLNQINKIIFQKKFLINSIIFIKKDGKSIVFMPEFMCAIKVDSLLSDINALIATEK